MSMYRVKKITMQELLCACENKQLVGVVSENGVSGAYVESVLCKGGDGVVVTIIDEETLLPYSNLDLERVYPNLSWAKVAYMENKIDKINECIGGLEEEVSEKQAEIEGKQVAIRDLKRQTTTLSDKIMYEMNHGKE